ncbi:deoxyribose-phosphate aldolase [Gracilibacillus marinus]|jgi:deoxyribose-phosphate aldolase|uniref:Deoxyribose-phosphate aldolase n=1 Tax=Gracilibacillus marinus TaxID=630535 RepID=A0ABV8VWX9_9BACI
MSKIGIAKAIDHTLLKPDATKEQVTKILNEAKQYHFASVCINPQWVKYASEALMNTDVKVCTVIGFPLGATTSKIKALETRDAIDNGATEIDMVIAIGRLKSGDDDYVQEDIKQVVDAAGDDAIVKVIIETTLLTEEEKIRACQLAKKAGADFVKTSTGFAGGGATVEDVKLMAKTVGDEMQVKASGGVKDLETMRKMIEAGATRIGASAGVMILNGMKSDNDY